jgi:hypothetical protein
VPVVLGDVRSLARRGFSLSDSGLYQDVVDKGCEIAHGARVRARAKVRVRTAVMQVSLGVGCARKGSIFFEVRIVASAPPAFHG